jgi:ABC-type multidrug transport system fused ATPase/permease subunit
MKGVEQPPDVMGSASLLSRLTISFPYNMMKQAYRRPLGIGDVPRLPSHLASRVTGMALLNARAERPERSLLFTIAWLWRAELCLALLLSMLWNMLFVLTPALLFPGLIFFLQDPTQPSWIGWVYVGAFLLASLLSSLVYSHAWFHCFLFAARAKAAVSFFAVTCALSREAMGSDTGLFVNLLGNDTERVFNFLQHAPYGLSSTVGLCGVVAALFVWMGPAPASIALGLSGLSFVLQRLVALRNASIRSRAIPLSDERVQRTGEVISAIQLVKLYAWEGPRSDQISALRRQEVRWLFWSALLQNYSSAVVVVVFWISLWGSLSCYLLLGGAVSAPVLFTIVSLFANLRFPLQMLANLFFFYGDSYQSFVRVNSLVNKLGQAAAEESELKHDLLADRRVCSQDELLLSIVNGSFRYVEPGVDVASVEPTLSNVNVEVRAGRVTCVVGAVGSGKSTLCAGLVGEASAVGVSISGTLSYAAQTAWIWNATLRDNICFGRPFDESWYREVVAACQLVTDFDSFPAGDFTFVGERGVTLSGGQRQRISIARAVYADRSFIVLDDVTSALDARVSRRLFEQLIVGLLRERNKGVLLITHQLPLCRHADTVVVLEAGKQMQSGAFAEVQKAEGPFRAMMRHYEEEEGGDDSPGAGKKMTAVDKLKKKSRDAVETASRVLASDGPAAEESKEGAVSGKVWTAYLALLGWRMAGLIFLSACSWNAVRVLADWWIVYLITGKFFASVNAFVFSWLGLTLGCVVLLLLQGTLFVRAAANAGQRLHDRVFFSVLAAPMSWFDVTPVGRVTNRLAKDLDAVDKLLPYSLDQFLQCILQCIAVVVLIAVALPWFLIALPFIFALFVLLSNFFRRSSTQLRRIDGIVRAPCFSSLTEALAGRVTIHSLGNGPLFASRLVALCDVWHSSLFAFWSTTRFFSLRLDVATSAVILCVTIISVSLRSASPASAAVAAVALR